MLTIEDPLSVVIGLGLGAFMIYFSFYKMNDGNKKDVIQMALLYFIRFLGVVVILGVIMPVFFGWRSVFGW